MKIAQVDLDFGGFAVEAELFDSPIAQAFAENLPYEVNLTRWGKELYGGIGKDLGSHAPIEDIPPGGIAYTNGGNLVCIFFGQSPAWPVDYIGQIPDGQWQQLLENHPMTRVIIRKK